MVSEYCEMVNGGTHSLIIYFLKSKGKFYIKKKRKEFVVGIYIHTCKYINSDNPKTVYQYQ